MKAIFALALVSVLTLAPQPSLAGPEPIREYRLAPQDRLMVRVYSIRKNYAEAYSWAPLSGEFTVGPSGSLALPLIGELKAAGRTTEDLAAQISRALQETANLSEPPSASVEIIQYSPFFILGAVQQPGKYEYQPGLTVLQALSIAQGLARASELSTVERDIIAASGDIRVLDAERSRLEVKLARLNAEIAEADTITYSREIDNRSADPRIALAMREEALRFKTRREALQGEIEAIGRSKDLLKQELQSLDEKGNSLDRQIEVNKREVRAVSNLVARGLAVSPRQLAAENTQANIESNRLDVQLAVLRAQQALSRAERDIVEVNARYRGDALNDAATTRNQIDQLYERIQTAERLLQNSEERSPATRSDTENVTPVFRITRNTASGAQTTTVEETARLEAGDVLQVVLPKSPRTSPIGRDAAANALTR